MVLICLAFACGCTAQTSPQKTQPQAIQVTTQVTNQESAGPTEVVHIIASSFDPAILNVKPGTTVTWINEDTISHRVEHLPQLPGEKLLFRSESLSPGESFSYTFMEPGRYVYGDPQHAGGRASLVIVG
ncbi:MAG: cupredoxin domain-containing protein [Methanoregula sp.]